LDALNILMNAHRRLSGRTIPDIGLKSPPGQNLAPDSSPGLFPNQAADGFCQCLHKWTFQENLGIRPSGTDRASIILQFHVSPLKGNDSDEINLEFSLVALGKRSMNPSLLRPSLMDA
jgi:hypothetical protein